MGHLWINCPDNNNTDKVPRGKEAAFFAIGDDDEDEDEGIYDTCFMTHSFF